MDCLIVVVEPFTLQRLLAISCITVFAESSFSGVISSDHYLPNIGFIEGPIVILTDNLDSIWHLMRTNFFLLKQVQSLWIL
jgi:hypothetical protein